MCLGLDYQAAAFRLPEKIPCGRSSGIFFPNREQGALQLLQVFLADPLDQWRQGNAGLT